MAYMCSYCGSNEVFAEGELCEQCAMGNAPAVQVDNMQYNPSASAGGASAKPGLVRRGGKSRAIWDPTQAGVKTDPYGNAISTQTQGGAPAVGATSGALSANTSTEATKWKKLPVTEGVARNITKDEDKRSFLSKWCQSLFHGTAFAPDDAVTMFQVFPDYGSGALNVQGYACDQVVFYGKVNQGAISDNNEVEVYGYRDRHNNVVARKIKNRATGAEVVPQHTIPAALIRIATIVFLLLAFAVIMGLGWEGMLWVGIILLCLTNLPLVFKIISAIVGLIFSIIKRAL